MKPSNIFTFIFTAILTLNLAVAQDADINNDLVSTSFHLDKFQRNITVFASGEDTPWSLEISRNNSMKLFIAPNTEVVASIYSKEENQKNKTTTYFAKFKNGNIQFEMSAEECKEFPHTNNFQSSAVLHFHDTTRSTYQLLKGCAEWIPNYRLHEIWMLDEVNGELFDRDNFYKNIPRIEFHLNNYKVYGFGGCNEFEGEFDLNHDILSIKNVEFLSQEKCALEEFEQQLIKDLQDPSYHFKVKEGVLKMSNKNKGFVFKRTD